MKQISFYINEAADAELKTPHEQVFAKLRRNCGNGRAAEMMDKLRGFKFKKVLGAGEEGVAVLLEDDRVMKIYYRDIPIPVSMLAAACKFMTPETLPKIIRGEFWITRSSYKVGSPKCKALLAEIRKALRNKLVKQEVRDWMEKADYELTQIGSQPLYLSDLKIDNFGEDRKGNVMIIDF